MHSSAAGQSRNDTQLLKRGLTKKPMKFFWEEAIPVLSRSQSGDGSKPNDFSSSPWSKHEWDSEQGGYFQRTRRVSRALLQLDVPSHHSFERGT